MFENVCLFGWRKDLLLSTDYQIIKALYLFVVVTVFVLTSWLFATDGTLFFFMPPYELSLAFKRHELSFRAQAVANACALRSARWSGVYCKWRWVKCITINAFASGALHVADKPARISLAAHVELLAHTYLPHHSRLVGDLAQGA